MPSNQCMKWIRQLVALFSEQKGAPVQLSIYAGR